MADEPISSLTLIAAPGSGYSTSFTSNAPATPGAQLEILDTTNTTMALTGTNSRIFPGDLLKGYLAAGTNVTLTETSGIVTITASGGGMTVGNAVSGGSNHATLIEDGSGNLAALAIGTGFSTSGSPPSVTVVPAQVNTVVSGAPAWANPVTSSYVQAVLGTQLSAGQYNLFTNILTITLPSAGTYAIFATVRGDITATGAVGNVAYIVSQLYDTTNSVLVAGSTTIGVFGTLQVASTNIEFVSVNPIGPIIYSVSASAVIALQSSYLTNGTVIHAYIDSDSFGQTTMTAVRIA